MLRSLKSSKSDQLPLRFSRHWRGRRVFACLPVHVRIEVVVPPLSALLASAEDLGFVFEDLADVAPLVMLILFAETLKDRRKQIVFLVRPRYLLQVCVLHLQPFLTHTITVPHPQKR